MNSFSGRCQKILVVIGAAQTVAANFPALTGLVPAAQVINLAAGATTARMNIPHGLGFRPALHCCRAYWVGADSNVTASIQVSVTATDTTNVVVKASAAAAAAEAAFLVVIELDNDVGGRYSPNQ